MLGRFIERVATCIVRNYRAHIPDAKIIGPGNWHIRSLDHIFATGIIKISVTNFYLLAENMVVGSELEILMVKI